MASHTDDLYSRTARELVDLHNSLCPPEARIGGPWKASKRALIERIRALGGPEAAVGPAEAAETVGELVRALLMTDVAHAEIAAVARRRFPGARTTARSVSSVACTLRRKGVAVPMRRGARQGRRR